DCWELVARGGFAALIRWAAGRDISGFSGSWRCGWLGVRVRRLAALVLVAAVLLTLLPLSLRLSERAPTVSVRVEVVGEGRVLVNGSVVSGGVLEVEPGSTLVILLEAPEHAEVELYVNGSRRPAGSEPLLMKVRGSTALKAVFKPRLAALHVDAGGLTVLAAGKGWEREVNGSATLNVGLGERVSVTALCRESGGGVACVERWIVLSDASTGVASGTLPPNATVQVLANTTLRAVVAVRTKEGSLLLLRGAVLAGGVEVPATLYPDELGGWSAAVEYLGGGAWRVSALGRSSMFIELPEGWVNATVEVWVERNYTSAPFAGVFVVVSESPQLIRGCSSAEALAAGSYFRVLLVRGEGALEVPEGWVRGQGYWPKPNPAARAGRLYLVVENLQVKLRVVVRGR
ncbi:MAG: hypothetical protein QXJ21_08975, partial [Thermofilum sp.]